VKGIYISEIVKNVHIQGIFLVKEKHMGVTKNGIPYLSLRLMDRTGDINARVWDDAEKCDRLFDKDDVIRVSGRSSVYQGGLQLTLSTLERCEDSEVALEDFLPVSRFPVEDMWRELQFIVDDIRDGYLKRLLRSFFDDESFAVGFKLAPAAKALHHVCQGGLLEHSLSVARLARLLCDNYEGVNRDLLVAGALLHDIGKVRELSYRKAFDYTDVGRLIGHISIGVELVESNINTIQDFPAELKMLLKHMILSHHGHYEYGSPKRPKTLEALMLYYLDDLDAKVNSFQQFVGKGEGEQTPWSSYHKFFDRYLFNRSYISREFPQEDPTGHGTGNERVEG
jgi:3'-5' exoribonuclease